MVYNRYIPLCFLIFAEVTSSYSFMGNIVIYPSQNLVYSKGTNLLLNAPNLDRFSFDNIWKNSLWFTTSNNPHSFGYNKQNNIASTDNYDNTVFTDNKCKHSFSTTDKTTYFWPLVTTMKTYCFDWQQMNLHTLLTVIKRNSTVIIDSKWKFILLLKSDTFNWCKLNEQTDNCTHNFDT